MSDIHNPSKKSKPVVHLNVSAAFENRERRLRTQRTSLNRKAPPPRGYFACRFLRQLAPVGPWVLTAIHPDDRRQITTSTFTAIEAARQFVAEHNAAGRGVYYSVNPTKTALQSKAKKTDIARIKHLHVDADPDKNETPEAFKERMLAKIAEFPHCPTFVIDSGNGLQLLFRLSAAVEITNAAVIADIEARNYALALAFGAAPVTRNIDRVLRLPGTINYPNEPKRRLGRQVCKTHLIGYFAERDYPLDTFPPCVPESRPARGNPSGETGELPARLRTPLLINDSGAGAPCGGYETRSHLMFAFLTSAVRGGFSDTVILNACLDPQYEGKGIFAHVKENGGRDFAARQLQRAHETVGQGRQHGNDAEETRPLVRRRIDQFERREIEWLWYPFVPLGMITLLCGDKAVGKSSVAIDMAARISTGRNWPRFGDDDEEAAALGSVIILCKENDISRIIRPRLEAAGADLSRVHTLGYEVADDPEQIDPLERLDTTAKQLEQQLAEIGDVKLIVVGGC
jgi:AAA domain